MQNPYNPANLDEGDTRYGLEQRVSLQTKEQGPS